MCVQDSVSVPPGLTMCVRVCERSVNVAHSLLILFVSRVLQKPKSDQTTSVFCFLLLSHSEFLLLSKFTITHFTGPAMRSHSPVTLTRLYKILIFGTSILTTYCERKMATLICCSTSASRYDSTNSQGQLKTISSCKHKWIPVSCTNRPAMFPLTSWIVTVTMAEKKAAFCLC